jgi:hypothetical protein
MWRELQDIRDTITLYKMAYDKNIPLNKGEYISDDQIDTFFKILSVWAEDYEFISDNELIDLANRLNIDEEMVKHPSQEYYALEFRHSSYTKYIQLKISISNQSELSEEEKEKIKTIEENVLSIIDDVAKGFEDGFYGIDGNSIYFFHSNLWYCCGALFYLFQLIAKVENANSYLMDLLNKEGNADD